MPLKIQPRFIGTGKPLNADRRLIKLRRSNEAINLSGSKKFVEFVSINKQFMKPSSRSIGDKVDRVPNRIRSGSIIDLEA